jgi:hypothetical protein
MGIIKDWRDNNSSFRVSTKIYSLFSPKEWYELHKCRKQRANRGWSNRDAWEAGDYVAKIVADMLFYLKDNSYVDWEWWFDNKYKKGKNNYKDLQSIIDDINNYLEFQKTSWADGLDADIDDVKKFSDIKWSDVATGKKLTDKQVTARINKYAAQEAEVYKKASRAMKFFGENFSDFWD